MTQEEYAKVIARNLKRIAYERGKTQADIARDLKINKQTVSSWFRAERTPRMDKIDLLCGYFGCRRSDIMEEHGEKTMPYYFNDEAREYAQFLFDNPEYKVLFDASRSVKKFVKQMIDRMTKE